MIKILSIRIPTYEKQQLAEFAAQNDTTVSQIVRKLIRNFLKENNK